VTLLEPVCEPSTLRRHRRRHRGGAGRCHGLHREERCLRGDDRVVKVTATDSKCEVSKTKFPAGHVQIDIENKGSKVTEVYLLFPDDRIVTERENIGPGTKQKVTAEVKAGDYRIACKPGMKGKGIRQDVTATGSGKVAKRDPRLDSAVAAYREYAQEQADETVPKAKVFAARRSRTATSRPRRRRTPLAHRLGADRARRRVLR
jgi:iron uptake system EfeUOB component EfeO/EfeM